MGGASNPCSPHRNGATALKILCYLLVVAALLTGCLPVGIRGSSLPYAGVAVSHHLA